MIAHIVYLLYKFIYKLYIYIYIIYIYKIDIRVILNSIDSFSKVKIILLLSYFTRLVFLHCHVVFYNLIQLNVVFRTK